MQHSSHQEKEMCSGPSRGTLSRFQPPSVRMGFSFPIQRQGAIGSGRV
ncbi:uncharacterized protein CCOS01_06655 [Colletotrichum costaricense]|uniref:Uncharacterized protein n=1 Tax=Colletotrichum costaricense TaxID=1209916 RepID=A0AAJ0E139_9PEZI|nr:uncharacterized protein CCOS01_06655 [Colletotrichum costaricense]KAK1528821.1 hypothetical protein CCOS01_06655 [Colletotrichum costaricense]